MQKATRQMSLFWDINAFLSLLVISGKPNKHLKSYLRILDPTKSASHAMGWQRPREGWFGHFPGIWETEACSPLPDTLPSSGSCVRKPAS